MKELTSYNRVAGYLNKVYDLLNAEFFESTLSRPTITIQSTPKAFGHFSLPGSVKTVKHMRSTLEPVPLSDPLKKLPPRCCMRWYTITTISMASRIVPAVVHTITANSGTAPNNTD